MAATTAGSVFLAVFLVLFPVAVQLSSGCVYYSIKETCGFRGSSVRFPCSFKHTQEKSSSGWSRKVISNMTPEPLSLMPAYSSRMMNRTRRKNYCSMNLTNLKITDASTYYFVYNFRNASGDMVTCKGVPGVTLHFFASPVRIVVDRFISGQYVPVSDLKVMRGQKIMLTCVQTCPANQIRNSKYTWYKNGLKINGSRAKFLHLDAIRIEDTGSYVCDAIGYKDFPSAAVNLTVQGCPKPIEGSQVPDPGPPITPTDTPKSKSMFLFSVMCVVCVCIGLVTVIIVGLVIRAKKKKRRCARPGTPDPNMDSRYLALDIKTMSSDYETMRPCPSAETVYEN